MFGLFRTSDVDGFARELAAFIMLELSGQMGARDHKFRTRAEKVLVLADRRVQTFKAAQRLNWFKKARLSNTFLWALTDAACPKDYATELTEWLTMRL